LLGLETITSGNFLETKSNCGEEYTSFAVLMILAMAFAAVLPQTIAFAVVMIKSVGSDKRSAYQILEQILAKANLEERNEAFLDACIEYSKEQVGKKEEDFDREHGLGKLEEIYSHFIRMEPKRLEEKRKAEKKVEQMYLRKRLSLRTRLPIWYELSGQESQQKVNTQSGQINLTQMGRAKAE
jgi:hypothetical protein